jgi:hypothetical protein
VYSLFTGILSVVGSFVLAWYEGDWGADYYADEAESPFFTDFYWMLDLLRYIGVGLIVFGVVMFLLGKKLERKEPEA